MKEIFQKQSYAAHDRSWYVKENMAMKREYDIGMVR